ncbi:hypothetical protein [Myxococcus landrumensis]|uniref:Uncharacterized protein n=1 Tax=Myxococcus landrumensis TaxID=2813577 RepID=A0ABX7NM83_9BACT|nr:hypothetical protein [Myxococcus landrumus]QSQ18589.1 hypothetical protein JY572_30430 [Myxococcus landrumus]
MRASGACASGGTRWRGRKSLGSCASPDAIRHARKADKVFEPKMKANARERHLRKWKHAVARA